MIMIIILTNLVAIKMAQTSLKRLNIPKSGQFHPLKLPQIFTKIFTIISYSPILVKLTNIKPNQSL